MRPLNKIWQVSLFTFKDYLYQKFFYIILLLSGAFFCFIYYINIFNLSLPEKILKDIGFNGMHLLCYALTLLLGITNLAREINSRHIYVILSKPISKEEYLWGRFLGAVKMILLTIILLTMILTLMVYFRTGEFTLNIIWGGLEIFLEQAIILAHLYFFSLFASPPLNLILGISIIILGNLSFNYIKFILNSSFLQGFAFFLKVILPDLHYFNIQSAIINNYFISPSYLLITTIYSFCYTLLIIKLTSLFLAHKNL